MCEKSKYLIKIDIDISLPEILQGNYHSFTLSKHLKKIDKT